MPVPRDYVGKPWIIRLEAWLWMRNKLRQDYKHSQHYDHSGDAQWGMNRRQLEEAIHSYDGDVTKERDKFNYLSYLYQSVIQFKPDNVVEIGVQNGRSTFAILQGLEDNQRGLLHSIDVIPGPKWFVAPLVPLRLKRRWRYHEGASEWRLGEILYHYPKIDMMFHDGAHEREQQLKEIKQVWNSGAKIVIVDHSPEAGFETYAENLDPKPSKGLTNVLNSGLLNGVLIR